MTAADEYRCCALPDSPHDGPCEWSCSDCGADGTVVEDMPFITNAQPLKEFL